MDDKHLIELNQIILSSLDGSVDEEKFTQLNKMIKEDQSVLEHYIDIMAIYTALCRQSCCSISSGNSSEYVAGHVPDIWQALAESEKKGEAVDVEPSEEERSEPVSFADKRKIVRRRRKISPLLLYTAISSIAALILLILFVYLDPEQRIPVVGKLADAMEVEWGQGMAAVEIGEPLRTGQIEVMRGCAKVAFTDGAEVIIEGPAKIALLSEAKMFIQSGKVTANVPVRAIGFTISTPASSVVDLGTEFGIEVSADGSSELHIFKGKASLLVGKSGSVTSSQIVEENQARRVDAVSGRVDKISIGDQRFARRMSSEKKFIWRGENQLDLSDVVGGGNGFGTGQKGIVLDPLTAEIVTYPQLQAGKHWTDIIVYVDKDRYKTVPSSTFIDGIFVPDGGQGPVQISSEKHFFNKFPDTNSYFWAGILNQGSVKNGNKLVHYHDMLLGGKRYGRQNTPGIFMHANIGVTFNLDIIRGSMPEFEIVSFKALCGLADDCKEGISNVDFYVLVDGKVRFEAVNIQRPGELKSIDVEIGSDNKFLTLVTTDNNGDNSEDHLIVALPRLELNCKD